MTYLRDQLDLEAYRIKHPPAANDDDRLPHAQTCDGFEVTRGADKWIPSKA